MMRRSAVIVVLILLSLDASGTTILRVSIEELTRVSALVIQGRVEDVKVVADPKDERRITTEVTIAIGRVLKGFTSAPRIKLSLPGGRTERWDARIPGMPSFEKGEEVVLFLEKTAAGFMPAGLVEGKYRVFRDAGQEARARRSLSGASVVTKSGTTLVSEGEVSHLDDDLPLETLVKRIRSASGGAR